MSTSHAGAAKSCGGSIRKAVDVVASILLLYHLECGAPPNISTDTMDVAVNRLAEVHSRRFYFEDDFTYRIRENRDLS
ncbi:hypothetical protein T265_00377 [Opisthorchis viverrini]|uniref:Uncharacterized protein n=1 Tax=Opisthorchis viverrini TaxID=6198 RepID=A0A075A2J6_OPIVI|nr:hypothetical protein T265_00377 [Opisthorchis viverrini]KER33943.1 hypothetical protein T265_00377 [Opisthorchis viverrini]